MHSAHWVWYYADGKANPALVLKRHSGGDADLLVLGAQEAGNVARGQVVRLDNVPQGSLDQGHTWGTEEE